jgi:hypothetical protein
MRWGNLSREGGEDSTAFMNERWMGDDAGEGDEDDEDEDDEDDANEDDATSDNVDGTADNVHPR